MEGLDNITTSSLKVDRCFFSHAGTGSMEFFAARFAPEIHLAVQTRCTWQSPCVSLEGLGLVVRGMHTA